MASHVGTEALERVQPRKGGPVTGALQFHILRSPAPGERAPTPPRRRHRRVAEQRDGSGVRREQLRRAGGHVGPDGTVRGLTPPARRVTFAEASPGRQARGRLSGDRDSAIVVMPRRVFGRSGESAEIQGLTPPARPRPPTTWGISICRQPPPPAAIVDHAQPQMTHGEQRPPGMAREKESSWSGPPTDRRLHPPGTEARPRLDPPQA